MKIKQLSVAVILSCVGVASHALDNGFDPDAVTAVVHPTYTNISTDLWKLVGTVSGVTAVQIAPNWILASVHGKPPQGSTFVNKYGQAVVGLPCDSAPGTYAITGTNDVSLCRLTTPINLPGTAAGFPKLSGVADEDLPNAADFNHWGELLTVGTAGGVRRAAWVQLSGIPVGFDAYDISVDPLKINANVSPLFPTTYDGDSGGGAFLFPADAPQNGILVGVLTGADFLGNAPTYLTRANVNWITTTIAGNGDTPPATVLIEQLVGDASARTPRNMPDNSVTATVTGATTATVTWAAPPADANNPTAITRYLTKLQGVGEATSRIATKTNPGNLYYTGLTDGKQYQACIQTGGAVGYGPNVRLVQSAVRGPQTVFRPGCASFVAGTPNAVTIDPNWDVAKNTSTGKTDLLGGWTAPVPNGVVLGTYLVTIKVWSSFNSYNNKSPAIRTTTIQTPDTSFVSQNVLSGNEHGCWTVFARSTSLTPGPVSANLCFGAVP